MANLLSLDIGEKRIGVALADMDAPFPAPLTTLEASEHLATEFAAILKKNYVTAVVIGLPRNQSGERTAQTDRVEQIAQLLNIPKEIPTYWQDESLTSVKAQEELERRKKPYAKAAVDALAATYILEDFIRTQASAQPAGPIEHVTSSKKNKLKKTKKKRIALKIFLALISLAVLVIAGSVAWYTRAISGRTSDDVYSVITVKSGSGTKQIAADLAKNNVIRSADAFSLYVKLNGVNNLQAGVYRLSSKQSVKSIVETIESGKVTTVNVLITPGQTLDEIFVALKKDGYTQAQLDEGIEAVRDHPLLKDVPTGTKLEGYLFPDTYRIGPGTSAEQLFRLMLDTFEKKITPDIRAGVAAQGLTLNQAVTLASIVQKEVGDPKVQPSVAQVFIKRYKEGIMLGSDVTALYGALSDNVALSNNSAQAAATAIAHSSPYNTRKIVGLPPTAISNFNISALSAVASPSKTDYLFFVAGDDGITHFSRTVQEHEALVNKYCIKLCG